MPVPPSDPGPFLSLMGWLDTAGQIAPNLIRGKPGAAGRKALDLLGDIPDALLPYDLIPHTGDEDEYIRPSELVGLDPMSSPALAKITDMVGGAALNPLSYGARPLAAAGRLSRDVAAKGFQQLPDALRKPIEHVGTSTRRALNWLDVDPESQAMLDRAKGAGYQSDIVRQPRVGEIYAQLTPDERDLVGEIGLRINRGGNADRAQWAVASDPETMIAERAASNPAINPGRVRQALTERSDLMELMAKDANAGLTVDRNYSPRQFSGAYFDDVEAPEFRKSGAGAPNAIRARQDALRSPEELLSFMQKNPDADLEFDALKVDAGRAANQARIVERASLGAEMLPKKVEELRARLPRADEPGRASAIEQEVFAAKQMKNEGAARQLEDELKLQEQYDSFKGGFKLTDEKHRAAVTSIIDDFAAKGDADTAYRLNNFFKGTPGKKGVLSLLATGSKYFKSAATFGVALPRMSFNVGNRASGLWQVLSVDGARGQIGPSSRRALGDLFGAVDDGIMKLTGKGRWATGELTQALDVVDQAARTAKGDVAKFRDYIKANGGDNSAMLQEALDDGVLTGFVDSEQLLTRMAQTPMRQRVSDFMDWPAKIAVGTEQRMRLGTYMDIRKSGTERASAAKTVKDVYLDYDTPGVANSTFRQIFPFGAFLSQSIKQQAKFLADKPFVATAAAPLFTDNDGTPKYPWMSNTMALPIGLDEAGDSQYLTSFRMPIESLATIPGGGGDDSYRDIVGSMHPLLKTAITAVTGKDAFTGRDAGTYSKIMGEEAGAVGRAYNVVKGTGLIQPLATPLDTIANWTDERKSAKERALQGLTGLRFTSVDGDMAARQRIEDYLKNSPDVGQYRGYFATAAETDPGLSDLLKDLADAKARIKAKREAAAGVL